MSSIVSDKDSISTHAPRTGSDEEATVSKMETVISTHAPRTGSDHTRPSRTFTANNFNPRSPHGERPAGPVAGADRFPFQPTLPARGATSTRRSTPSHRTISTHAPRTGSDDMERCDTAEQANFNPRSPHGERRQHYDRTRYHLLFQPTLPARGATLSHVALLLRLYYFNPRSPHGERHCPPLPQRMILLFQPTLPARGATVPIAGRPPLARFQPTLPARGATKRPVIIAL